MPNEIVRFPGCTVFYQELINYIVDWFKCRRWRSMLWLSLPLACLLIAVTGLIGYGYFGRSNQQLVRDYLGLAEEEMASRAEQIAAGSVGVAEKEPANSDAQYEDADALNLFANSGTVSGYAAMLLRRVLQTEEINHQAAFWLARDLGLRGQMGTARRLMRKIAPLDGRRQAKLNGLSAAHAWLALEQLRSNTAPEAANLDMLLQDLSMAMRWEGVTPELVQFYADTLVADGRAELALAVLNEHIKQFPALQIRRVMVARKLNNERELTDAVTAIRIRVPDLIADGRASPQDYADYSSVLLLSSNSEEACKIAQYGLQAIDASSIDDKVVFAKLRRILSEGLRQRYRNSISKTPSGTSVDLQLLDASLQADPTNPNTITEVALLVSEGATATPEMISALKRGLADGIAPTVTHLLLANTLIKQNKPQQAIYHLEAALSKEPRNAVALNNLALALSMIEPPELEKALAMVDRAEAIGGTMPEILDTRGQILMKQGNIPAAILCFEDAIGLDRTAIESRLQLAAAYKKLGMQVLATQQLSRIAELKSNTADEGDYP